MNSPEGLKVRAAEPKALQVPAGGLKDVVLAASTQELAKVTGSINIVNAPGGSRSSASRQGAVSAAA